MDLGEHWVFIVAAYAAAFVLTAALIGWIAADARRQKARLEALEASGIRRRSDGPAA
ncbi:MAG TPA: heme exporter protein CcmD [Devosiaceae bacterium]|nr:heme exporter protein CcmD [Devosiaceae bacterium]